MRVFPILASAKSPAAPSPKGEVDPLVTDALLCRLMCKELHVATNLSLDPQLIERALELSGARTKKAAVTLALQEYIARREQGRITELFGKLEWDPSFDYKKHRSRS